MYLESVLERSLWMGILVLRLKVVRPDIKLMQKTENNEKEQKEGPEKKTGSRDASKVDEEIICEGEGEETDSLFVAS